MRRAVLAPSTLALVALALVGCTSSPPEPEASASASASPSAPVASGKLPTCEAIGEVITPITTGLTFDQDVSTAQTAPEAYAQRVCVFVAPDGVTQVGVTIAEIPFLQEELDAYATLPGAIADDRLGDSGAVLQTLDAQDRTDGHLDSALYLFDTAHSITVQGYSTAGELAAVLPALTIGAASDAAFAVRGLF